jgi:hypothetical protein
MKLLGYIQFLLVDDILRQLKTSNNIAALSFLSAKLLSHTCYVILISLISQRIYKHDENYIGVQHQFVIPFPPHQMYYNT